MNMRYYISEKRYVTINNIDTVKEYKNFKRRSNGSWGADEEHLDDRVYSLMWALMILDSHITKDYFEVVEVDPQGKPLKMIPNFDTYIKNVDMIIPKRFNNRNELNSNTNFNKYNFTPTIIPGNTNSDMFDLQSQGWEPVDSQQSYYHERY